MQSLRLGGVLFSVVALLCLIVGGSSLYMGAEASDNVCDDYGPDPCRGRDARAQSFGELGQFMLWGGFLVLIVSAGLFALAGRRTA
ncbi:MAG: hypothetical protein AABY18_07105 [Candidatus Thermoplasmatota archaeon]